jgi:hypothetical protein
VEQHHGQDDRGGEADDGQNPSPPSLRPASLDLVTPEGDPRINLT